MTWYFGRKRHPDEVGADTHPFEIQLLGMAGQCVEHVQFAAAQETVTLGGVVLSHELVARVVSLEVGFGDHLDAKGGTLQPF